VLKLSAHSLSTSRTRPHAPRGSRVVYRGGAVARRLMKARSAVLAYWSRTSSQRTRVLRKMFGQFVRRQDRQDTIRPCTSTRILTAYLYRAVERPLPIDTGRLALALSLLAGAPAALPAWQTTDAARMVTSGSGYHLIGPLYYVGSKYASAFLITTPQGHILLDCPSRGAGWDADRLIKSITGLGFRVEDVRVLLNSHEHADHGGCLAEIKRRSGARLVALAAARPYLSYPFTTVPVGYTGRPNSYAWEPHMAVAVDQVINDGDTVSLGGVTLTAHATPLHTAGSTTWSMTVVERGRPYRLVIDGGQTIDGVIADSKTIDQVHAKWRALKAEIFFCGHPRKCGFAKMHPERAMLKDDYVRRRPVTGTRDTLDNLLIDTTAADWLAYLDHNKRDNHKFFAEFLERSKNRPARRYLIDSLRPVPAPVP
jgi:metallo-beta-lactamase class B